MPKKPPPREPKTAQVDRAFRLRQLIRGIESGKRPADAPPKTPREITDEAARKKWEEEKGGGS